MSMAGAWSQAPRHTTGSRVKRPSAVVSPRPMPRRVADVRAISSSLPSIQQQTLSHTRITWRPTGRRKIRL